VAFWGNRVDSFVLPLDEKDVSCFQGETPNLEN
jgi:hypothetical protein